MEFNIYIPSTDKLCFIKIIKMDLLSQIPED